MSGKTRSSVTGTTNITIKANSCSQTNNVYHNSTEFLDVLEQIKANVDPILHRPSTKIYLRSSASRHTKYCLHKDLEIDDLLFLAVMQCITWNLHAIYVTLTE